MKVYVVGSLRNDLVRYVADELREWGHEVFDDWHASGPEADDHWQKYEEFRGRTYFDALADSLAADNQFSFDMAHLREAEAVVLVAPAGRSAHLELGYAAGLGAFTAVFLTEVPERWDIMYKLVDLVYSNPVQLKKALEEL